MMTKTERLLARRVAEASCLDPVLLCSRLRRADIVEARWLLMTILYRGGTSARRIARLLGLAADSVSWGLLRAGARTPARVRHGAGRAVPGLFGRCLALETRLALAPPGGWTDVRQEAAIRRACTDRGYGDLAAYLLGTLLCRTRPDGPAAGRALLALGANPRLLSWCAGLLARTDLAPYAGIMARHVALFQAGASARPPSRGGAA